MKVSPGPGLAGAGADGRVTTPSRDQNPIRENLGCDQSGEMLDIVTPLTQF